MNKPIVKIPKDVNCMITLGEKNGKKNRKLFRIMADAIHTKNTRKTEQMRKVGRENDVEL